MNAALCQYAGEQCHDTGLPFTGLDVWLFVAAGVVLIVLGLTLRAALDRR